VIVGIQLKFGGGNALTDLMLKSFLIITEKEYEIHLVFHRVIAKK